MVRRVAVSSEPLACNPACLLEANKQPPPPGVEVSFSYEQLVTDVEERVSLSACRSLLGGGGVTKIPYLDDLFAPFSNAWQGLHVQLRHLTLERSFKPKNASLSCTLYGQGVNLSGHILTTPHDGSWKSLMMTRFSWEQHHCSWC